MSGTKDTCATLRVSTLQPGHGWWDVLGIVAAAAIGTPWARTVEREEPRADAERSLEGARLEFVTAPDLLGARNCPIEVGSRRCTMGMTTPTAAGRMAVAGLGPFATPVGSLEAIAVYPHDDFLIFLADARYGARTLGELLELRPALRVSTGRGGEDEPEDVLTYVVHEVLRRHGGSFSDLRSWGGQVFHGGPVRDAGGLVLDGRADALFHEAQNQRMWPRIAAARPMSVLGLDPDLLDDLSTDLGLRKRMIPSGHPAGNREPFTTLDFSGWLLYVHANVPWEWGYALAAAVDRTRPRVEGLKRGVTPPLRNEEMFSQTGIPLHEGARAYAEACGYLAP